MEPPPPSRNVLSRCLHRLDAMLGVEPDGRSDWVWAVPAAVLVGTVAAFLVIGQITAAPLAVSLLNGLVIAAVMAGLSVACIPTTADRGEDDEPPDDGDDLPVLGSPGGPWILVARLTPSPVESIDAGDPGVVSAS